MNTETQRGLYFPLAGKNAVQILFSEPTTTQEDLERIKALLDLAKDSFPKRSASETDQSDRE